MDWNAVAHLATQYGPVVPLCAFFLWREMRRDKREDDRDARWEAIQKDHIASDTAQAVAMTLLAERLNHVRGL